MLYKLLTGSLSRIDVLRLKVSLGMSGRAHQYADHFWVHYTDRSYMDRYDFYSEHNLNYKVNNLK